MEHTLRPHTLSDSDTLATSPDALAAARGRVMRPTPDLAEAMNRGYEPKDISLRGLFIFLFTLVFVLIVVLAAIYAIMMALVENDRSHDPLGTPVSIARPDTYAPLQPSVSHPTEDWEDMAVMREETQQVLLHPTLDRQIPIDVAINRALPLLVVRPVVPPTPVVLYPKGSIEGHFAGTAEDGPTLAP